MHNTALTEHCTDRDQQNSGFRRCWCRGTGHSTTAMHGWVALTVSSGWRIQLLGHASLHTHNHILTDPLSLVRVVMMRSKGIQDLKIYSHADSLILSSFTPLYTTTVCTLTKAPTAKFTLYRATTDRPWVHTHQLCSAAVSSLTMHQCSPTVLIHSARPRCSPLEGRACLLKSACKGLTFLDLSFNELGLALSLHLTEALRGCGALRKLYMRHCLARWVLHSLLLWYLCE